MSKETFRTEPLTPDERETLAKTIENVSIDRGSHGHMAFRYGHCVMEVVSAFNVANTLSKIDMTQQLTDHPQGVCPGLTRGCILINDSCTHSARQELRALVPYLIGSARGKWTNVIAERNGEIMAVVFAEIAELKQFDDPAYATTLCDIAKALKSNNINQAKKVAHDDWKLAKLLEDAYNSARGFYAIWQWSTSQYKHQNNATKMFVNAVIEVLQKEYES